MSQFITNAYASTNKFYTTFLITSIPQYIYNTVVSLQAKSMEKNVRKFLCFLRHGLQSCYSELKSVAKLKYFY